MMLRAQFSPDPWGQLSELVRSKLGLHFPEGRREDLIRCFGRAAKALGFEDHHACIEWLLGHSVSPATLKVLANHLTVGETYFFRDPLVLDALTSHALPPLIDARRNTKSLRIWCAACCTGEEAYTVAILLHQLIPDIGDWDISLLATDVNSAFLERASVGRYGEWSFRGVAGSSRNAYFEPNADGSYSVLSKYRRMVRFEYFNLADGIDRFPHLEIRDMDLVFCRNVLMYFDPALVPGVAAKLWNCMSEGGWLVTAPGEISTAHPSGFQLVSYPGAILLQKKQAPRHRSSAPEPNPMRSYPVSAGLGQADPSASQCCSDLHTAELARLARSCADQGDLRAALDWCDRWLQLDCLSPDAHYMRAVVLLEDGDVNAARTELQRTLYLAPRYVMAHFFMGHVAGALGDAHRAGRHFEMTQQLLGRSFPGAILPGSDVLTTRDMAAALRTLSAAARPRC